VRRTFCSTISRISDFRISWLLLGVVTGRRRARDAIRSVS
jgi:hypothetical protein